MCVKCKIGAESSIFFLRTQENRKPCAILTSEKKKYLRYITHSK